MSNVARLVLTRGDFERALVDEFRVFNVSELRIAFKNRKTNDDFDH